MSINHPLKFIPHTAEVLVKPTTGTGWIPVCAVCKRQQPLLRARWRFVQHLELQASWPYHFGADSLKLIIQPLRCDAFAWELWLVAHRYCPDGS